MIQKQGRKAAKNGRISEQLMRAAEMFCDRLTWNQYLAGNSVLRGRECIVSRHPYTTIYGTSGHREFMLQLNRQSAVYVRDDDGMIRIGIEFKNQDVAGSVDEKLPYIVENFLEAQLRNLWIVLTGSYWKSGRGDCARRYLIRKAASMNPACKHMDVFLEDGVIEHLRKLMNSRLAIG